MPSIRFRLEKPTVSGLAQRVARDYGPDARIVDTEERVVGGIAGIFGRRVIDVTVELPEAAPEHAHEFSMRSRVGLAALLDDADAHDYGPATEHGADPYQAAAPKPSAVSTQGGDFAAMLDSLRIDVEPSADGIGGGTPARPLSARRAEPPATPMTFDALVRPRSASAPAPAAPVPVRAVSAAPRRLELTSPIRTPVVPQRAVAPVAPPPPTPQEIAAAREYVWATPQPRSRMGMATPGAAPAPRTRAGDLLLLVGQGDDPVRVANALRARLQKGYLCDGGAIEGNTRRRVDDRHGALAARAYGVRSDQPVIVAYGIGDGDLDDPRHAGLMDIDSDQAWLVVDASQEPEAVLDWTGRLRGRVQVDAVASVRATGRGPHDALLGIGLPEAWRELAG